MVKIISRTTRLEKNERKKKKKKEKGHATRLPPLFASNSKAKENEQTGRTPGANNYSDIDKNEFIGLTGSYRGRGNNRAWKDSIFEINVMW